VLRLADSWIWDFWLADDGLRYHVFYLKASRALGDPDRRHWHATIGHAISDDLCSWTEVVDALAVGTSRAFDDMSTWTGSVVRGDSGLWHMFYTGVSRSEAGSKQRIGLATSPDLHAWTKHDQQPLLESDPRWYEHDNEREWPDEAWRDPWVFRDPSEERWHMLITARAAAGPADDRGVIGHASSANLVDWDVGPPLSAPGSGFGHLEVPQIEIVDGRAVLGFSCLAPQMAARRRGMGGGGVWCVPAIDVRGPYSIRHAVPISDDSLYSGRLVSDRSGRWAMLAFRNVRRAATGGALFVGELSEPMSVSWNSAGTALDVTSATS